MTRVLRDADVRALAGFPYAVEMVGRGVVGAARSGAAAERSIARFGSGWLRIMSGSLPEEDLLGFKAFHLIPGAGVHYLCALYRLSTGEPLALIDANQLTVTRTSAAAAAAAAHHVGETPIDVGVIGAGLQARDGLRALASVCAVRRVRVHSPRPASREAYARELGGELGVAVEPASDPAAATVDADLVLCATQTDGEVALSDGDAGPARYISSVSSTLPVQRELDEATIVRAERVIVDTRDALEEAGDLLAARDAGLDDSRVQLLSDHLAGPPGAPTGGLVVYKSIGSVEQDLALAAAVWRAAEEQDRGQVIEPIERRKELPTRP